MNYIELKKGSKQPLKRHNYYSSLDNISDAAIALDNDKGVIFIDFDNLESNNDCENRIIEGILKEYPSSLVVTTTKGKHLYYKTSKSFKQWTRGYLNIGVQCDGKMGNAYGVIKQNGIVRDYQGELSFDNLTELPEILYPMYIGKEIENLCGLKDNEGRHNKLLRHLCQVKTNYGDEVDLSVIARFINKYVFDESMTEEGINNVVESAKEFKIDKIELNPEKSNYGLKAQYIIKICKKLVEDYDMHVADNQIFYRYNNRYINDAKKLMELIYDTYEYTRGEYEEILFQLKVLSKEEQSEKSIISLRNGAIIDGKFYRDCDEFSSTYLDVNFDENAYDKEVDNFLQFISNNENSTEKNELRIIIEEMIGHCLMTKNFPHKIFLLVGIGANGKSTLMNMLMAMFQDLATNVPIKRLERDDYIARLTNKLVNISDDVDFSYITSSQNIKTLASGDDVVARELYSKSYHFKNKATMIFSMNELIIFSDKTYGMERRLCIIPFDNKIKNPNPSIINKLTTDKAKSYLLRLGLEAMNRIINNGYQLTNSNVINKEIKRYMIENDSVYGFLNDFENQIVDETFSDVYCKYERYCKENDYRPYKKVNFSRKLKTRGYKTDIRSIDGKSKRVIVKEEE